MPKMLPLFLPTQENVNHRNSFHLEDSGLGLVSLERVVKGAAESGESGMEMAFFYTLLEANLARFIS